MIIFSSGNGIAESAVKSVEEMWRCIQLGPEERLGCGVKGRDECISQTERELFRGTSFAGGPAWLRERSSSGGLQGTAPPLQGCRNRSPRPTMQQAPKTQVLCSPSCIY
eukprot:4128950-Amphidinium_carterae.2